MNVLIDTNIMLDFLTEHAPFFENADRIMQMCQKRQISGFIAAHSVMNVFFILRKEYSVKERRDMLMDFMKLVSVVGIDSNNIEKALKREDFSDVEDCLQDECALKCKADYIITRNVGDYKHSLVPAIEPDVFFYRISETEAFEMWN